MSVSLADVALVGSDVSGKVALTVEAKADEPFGETVGEALVASVKRLIKSPESMGLRRIEALAAALFKPPSVQPASTRMSRLLDIGALRYQLLTATAGTLVFAHQVGAGRAVMIVHELVTDRTRKQHVERNGADPSCFGRRLSAAALRELPVGVLIGPFDSHATDAWRHDRDYISERALGD